MFFIFPFFLGVLLLCIHYPTEIVNYNINKQNVLLKSDELIKHLFVMIYAIIMYYLPVFVIVMLIITLCNFSFQSDFWQINLIIVFLSYVLCLKKLTRKIPIKKLMYSFFYFSLGYFLTTIYWILNPFFDKTNNTLSYLLNYLLDLLR